MGSKINFEVRSDYEFYKQLHFEKKILLKDLIELNETKPTHKKTRTKSVDVKHTIINKDLRLCVESDKTNLKNFKFQLWCEGKYHQPYFRFDSDGTSHKNNDPKIPLEEQQITTPHFHFFQENGIEIAYKTDHLKDPMQSEAIVNDINFAITHFCYEATLETDQQKLINIVQTPNTEFSFPEPALYDPMKHISFE